MPQDRPTAPELLEAVREFLSDRVMEKLDSQTAFHCRVAVNVLALLEREWRLGGGFDAAERERLGTLLGRDGPLGDLNAELSKRLRKREIDYRKEELHAHLRQTVRDKLRIANPTYLEAEDRETREA